VVSLVGIPLGIFKHPVGPEGCPRGEKGKVRRGKKHAGSSWVVWLVLSQVPKDVPWFRHPLAQLFMAGFLPFSAIYIELHYIFNSIWGHKIYTLFGILVLAFIMLFIVTSFITIALTYFQVNEMR